MAQAFEQQVLPDLKKLKKAYETMAKLGISQSKRLSTEAGNTIA